MSKSFVMTESALENYGDEWRDVVLIPTHVATKYMPAAEFFAKGKPEGYHPGYDGSFSGERLYDLKRQDTGEDIPFSLYGWELKQIS